MKNIKTLRSIVLTSVFSFLSVSAAYILLTCIPAFNNMFEKSYGMNAAYAGADIVVLYTSLIARVRFWVFGTILLTVVILGLSFLSWNKQKDIRYLLIGTSILMALVSAPFLSASCSGENVENIPLVRMLFPFVLLIALQSLPLYQNIRSIIRERNSDQ